MMINYWAVSVSSVMAMVVGYFWYGPLWSKKWLEVIGATELDLEARKQMQQRSTKLYILQFVLVVIQVWVLAYFIAGWQEVSGMEKAMWIWLAFVMPTVAASSMWNNDTLKVSLTRFLLQAGYQLIVFVMYGFILSSW
jgi:hypothetical protein